MKPAPSVVTLTNADLKSVEALRKHNTETLGFLAEGVLSHYLESGGGLGLKTQDNRLVAYLLFARHKSHIRIIHLCVTDEARGDGCARALVKQLILVAKKYDIGVIKLSCRRDYPAHSMWTRLGFVPLGEKPAKTSGQRLTQWYFAIEGQGERDLFHIAVSDRKVNAVIDAQIFFHLHESDSDQAMISKGLQADFLDDLLQLYITDEIFIEINRSHSDERREISRNNAHSFWKASYDLKKIKEFSSNLEHILPIKTDSQKSDIQHLAKTAASDVNIFLTLDQRLLRASNSIQKAIGVRVLSPTEIIVQLVELTDPGSYIATPLSGSDLVWRKFDRGNFSDLKINRFLAPSERRYSFRKPLDESLSQPNSWQTYGIWLQDELVAIRSTSVVPESGQIVVKLCRASRGSEFGLFTKFVIASVLYEAVRDCVQKILILPDSVALDAVSDLQDLGFVETPDGFVRLCPSEVMPYDSLKRVLHDTGHNEFELQKLEKMCSPVVLEDSLLDCFMVPIKPGYARGLFDTNLARDDMFGAERSVLLRWSNVYYRRKTHHKMLKAPARILWYVSGSGGRVVAVSHLDTITHGSPKEMFHQHRHMGGVLDRSDIYSMCQGTKVQEIMVLRFSHTYLFNLPVVLHDLRTLYKKHDSNLILQSPSRVPKALLLDIFQMGYKRRPRS